MPASTREASLRAPHDACKPCWWLSGAKHIASSLRGWAAALGFGVGVVDIPEKVTDLKMARKVVAGRLAAR
jgi:hypothetical protein